MKGKTIMYMVLGFLILSGLAVATIKKITDFLMCNKLHTMVSE